MYKAVTLAGGIREPLLTCSSYLYKGNQSYCHFVLHDEVKSSLPLYELLCILTGYELLCILTGFMWTYFDQLNKTASSLFMNHNLKQLLQT